MSEAMKQLMPYVLVAVSAVLGSLGGYQGGYGSGVAQDVTGAKEWKEQNIERLMHVERLEIEVIALRAQQETLYVLLREGACKPEY